MRLAQLVPYAGLAYGEAPCSERTPINATAPLEPLVVMITKSVCEQVV